MTDLDTITGAPAYKGREPWREGLSSKFFDDSQWSSVIVEPSLWWRIKAVFIRPTIIFVWGQDRYMLRGFKGEWRFSCGGVPTEARKDIERLWRTK